MATPTPIDLIKLGIERGKWGPVCDGFALLTGIRLPEPKASPAKPMEVGVNASIQAAVDEAVRLALKNLGGPTFVPRDEQESTITAAEDVEVESSAFPANDAQPVEAVAETDTLAKFRVKNGNDKTSKSVPWTPPTGNKFVDNHTLAPELVDDSKNFRPKPEAVSAEARPAYQPIELECSGCRKTFQVNPNLRPPKWDAGDESSWKCDKCAGRR